MTKQPTVINGDFLLKEVLYPENGEKTQETRVSILTAAIRVIALEGIESLTFEKIASQIGTNRSHIRYHFKELNDVLFDAMKFITYSAQSQTAADLKAESGWMENILSIAKNALRHAFQNPDHIIVMLAFNHRASFDPRFSALYEEIRSSGRRRIASLLATVYPNVKSTKDVTEQLAAQIQSLLFGCITEQACSKRFKRLDAFENSVLTAVSAIVTNGLSSAWTNKT
jgi:AcrR family transcriptional regulator